MTNTEHKDGISKGVRLLCQIMDATDLEKRELTKSLDLAGLEITPKDSGWQPIETAPKDGVLVLLCGTEGQIETGRWNPNFTARNRDDPDTEIKGAWASCGGWFYDDEVTHWQPLPSPPIKQGDEG